VIELKKLMPQAYAELLKVRARLEKRSPVWKGC